MPDLRQGFRGAVIVCAMSAPFSVLLADSRQLQVTGMACPERIALYTNFGPILLDPFALAIMLGKKSVLIPRFLALKLLGFF